MISQSNGRKIVYRTDRLAGLWRSSCDKMVEEGYTGPLDYQVYGIGLVTRPRCNYRDYTIVSPRPAGKVQPAHIDIVILLENKFDNVQGEV